MQIYPVCNRNEHNRSEATMSTTVASCTMSTTAVLCRYIGPAAYAPAIFMQQIDPPRSVAAPRQRQRKHPDVPYPKYGAPRANQRPHHSILHVVPVVNHSGRAHGEGKGQGQQRQQRSREAHAVRARTCPPALVVLQASKQTAAAETMSASS